MESPPFYHEIEEGLVQWKLWVGVGNFQIVSLGEEQCWLLAYGILLEVKVQMNISWDHHPWSNQALLRASILHAEVAKVALEPFPKERVIFLPTFVAVLSLYFFEEGRDIVVVVFFSLKQFLKLIEEHNVRVLHILLFYVDLFPERVLLLLIVVLPLKVPYLLWVHVITVHRSKLVGFEGWLHFLDCLRLIRLLHLSLIVFYNGEVILVGVFVGLKLVFTGVNVFLHLIRYLVLSLFLIVFALSHELRVSGTIQNMVVLVMSKLILLLSLRVRSVEAFIRIELSIPLSSIRFVFGIEG